MKSRRQKQKIDDYTRERREHLRDKSVSTVTAAFAPGKKLTPDFPMPANYAHTVTSAPLGAVTDADLKL